MVNVVVDSPELFATYSQEGSEFHFPEGDWPTPDGLHPWHDYGGWRGHGALMMQRPGDPYAIWHFWDGPQRRFAGWYVNFEAPFERTSIGFDTRDLELDIVIDPDGSWEFKDVDLLWQRHDEGRFTLIEVRRILELGDDVGAMIESGGWWWDPSWTQWAPDPGWTVPALPDGWEKVATVL
jgi:hypothetical protein